MYQKGQAWVTALSSAGVVLGPLPPRFSHSSSGLPLPVLLGKFPILAWPAVLCLGESLFRGIHSAQLTFQGPLGTSGSAAGAQAAGNCGFTDDWNLLLSISQSVKWVQSLFPQMCGKKAEL